MFLFRPTTLTLIPRTHSSALTATTSASLHTGRSTPTILGALPTADSRVGTVALHRVHLVVCNSSSAEWPSRVETMSEPITTLARGCGRLPGRAMVTLSDFAPVRPPSPCSCSCNPTPPTATKVVDNKGKYDRIDVAVFPLGIVAKQLDTKGAEMLLEWLSRDTILPTSWSTDKGSVPFDHAWLELTKNRHIFVCTHGSRDRLCGTHGGALLREVRRVIEERGVGKHVAAWETSHVGGHKYAANAIIYPRGDWYGTWCDRCGKGVDGAAGSGDSVVEDARALVDAALRDVVWWDAWRGATNMSKEDQIQTWMKNTAAENTEMTEEREEEEKAAAWVPPSTLSRRKSS
ncbi:hypothetical protein GGF37_004182 [Kickxella alabastrina]|nr:hypothetical protein GGF37_004182 [Kickxella alabastrina]